MLRLQSKKIGIMLKVKQLSDTRILNEINRMMFEGAEILIILLGEKNEHKTGFPALFHQLAVSQTDYYNVEGILFDLLVFIPCTGKQLSILTETLPRSYNGLPLVIAPLLEKDPQPPFGDLSALLETRKVYFVPFGPLTHKIKGKKQAPSLFSRLDLLTEACIAALEGEHLKHSFWENNFFPG